MRAAIKTGEAVSGIKKERLLLFRLHPLLVFFALAIMFAACGSTSKTTGSLPAAKFATVPDYSNLYYWAAHPWKADLSDSTPEPYKDNYVDSSIDVFFIHPTTYVDDRLVNEELLPDSAEEIKWNAAIDDSLLNEKTDASSMLFQASVFNHYRVFAPRYRQAHYNSFFIADSLAKPFFDIAYEDVKNAFRYYLEHFNNGRPFIIASHSQGTLHAMHLLKDTIENTSLLKQMVAAYIIGLPIPDTFFTICKPCSTPSETNCFVTWRTFKSNYYPPFIANEKIKAVVVNPLTWTLDTLPAPRSLNRGAVLFKFNEPKNHSVSAAIHGNILWASKPKFFGSIFYTKKTYHIGDINLFWKNIRDNVDERVKAYKQLNKL
jgi:hypothetical protein